jgi:hypothetical protein
MEGAKTRNKPEGCCRSVFVVFSIFVVICCLQVMGLFFFLHGGNDT